MLAIDDLHGSLEDPALASMTFLNEIAGRYPDAVSLAAGRPYEEFYEVEDLHTYLRRFTTYLSDDLGYDRAAVTRALFQYGRTKGIIHHLIARNLLVDEQIEIDPESVVVTVGCQEAMFLVLRALRRDERDVLLAVSPTYVGLTGAARLVDLPVRPVATDLSDLTEVARSARAEGLRPRALYVMPDFANPSGLSLSRAQRLDLLAAAEEQDLLLIEDNPYGLFHGDSAHEPTLKSLDAGRRVVYCGSFAKTALPGVRIGYAVADQPVAGAGLLADELAKIKSMLTVNTSAVAQAVAGGKLLSHDCSLIAGTERERSVYAANLALVTDGLAERFPDPDVTWTVPAGGFFVVVNVPFVVDDAVLERSAREFGVLWTPMAHFYDQAAEIRALRLSCSVVSPAEIDLGLDRLAELVKTVRAS